MTTSQTDRLATSAPSADRSHVGAGAQGLVLAGDLGSAPEAVVEHILESPRSGQGLLVLDLTRRTLVIVPSGPASETRLALSGELDLAGAAMFASALDVALRHHPARVGLDLRRLTFIDAHNAGLVVAAAQTMQAWGGTLAVRGASDAVRRVLDACPLPLAAPPATPAPVFASRV